MKILFYSLMILFALPLAASATEKNYCEKIEIKKLPNNKIFSKFKNNKPFVKKLSHTIVGWNSSKSGQWIVVYGGYSLPDEKIGDEPLSMISVFSNAKVPKLAKKLIINKGVYEIKFDSADNIYISEPSGILKISSRTLRQENLGMLFDIDSREYDSCENLHP